MIQLNSKKHIYLDNAATTCVHPEVFTHITPYLKEKYGNPSSIHYFGRAVKYDLEQARKNIAQLLGVKPGEIFFTSGGTESMNTALCGLVYAKDEPFTIITTHLEHSATIYTIAQLQKSRAKLEVSYLNVNEKGQIFLDDLMQCLSQIKHKAIVCLMAANNEIGTIYDVKKIGLICKEYGACFVSDMVQMIGHYDLSLKDLHVDIATASGHKFHAPKGVGIMYVSSSIVCSPLILGGGQERNMRGGTENLCGIIGFSKALELQMQHLEKDRTYITGLKTELQSNLQTKYDCKILGDSSNHLYFLLNVAFTLNKKTEMLVYQLDMHGIAVSSGSACSSGSMDLSHVVQHIYAEEVIPIRFSFSVFNTKEEIQEVLTIIQSILS